MLQRFQVFVVCTSCLISYGKHYEIFIYEVYVICTGVAQVLPLPSRFTQLKHIGHKLTLLIMYKYYTHILNTINNYFNSIYLPAPSSPLCCWEPQLSPSQRRFPSHRPPYTPACTPDTESHSLESDRSNRVGPGVWKPDTFNWHDTR